jgi:hypothetical protein
MFVRDFQQLIIADVRTSYRQLYCFSLSIDVRDCDITLLNTINRTDRLRQLDEHCLSRFLSFYQDPSNMRGHAYSRRGCVNEVLKLFLNQQPLPFEFHRVLKLARARFRAAARTQRKPQLFEHAL